MGGGAGPPAGGGSEATAEARVWVSDGPRNRFPERDPGRPPLPPTGVCFSGGGTRALAAAAGQLRGLTATGLIADVGYLACVSGGAWAAVPYTYHAAGARDDAELLGAVRPPEAVRLRSLAALPEERLDHPATASFEGHLAAAMADADLPRDQAWTRAVGATYLAPFGLFDPAAPAWFTSDAGTAGAIAAANPHLVGTPFHAVHRGAWRPHLVINACLVWPPPAEGPAEERQRVGFEYTPLGVGTPCRSMLRAPSGAGCTVGGGYLESFAFGCPAPGSGADDGGRIRVVPPARPFTLADATGATSVTSTRAATAALVPRARHWPPGANDGQPGRVHSFGDGGDIENFGLIALLRRRVERIVVFVNTLHPLAAEVRPGAPSGALGIDPYVPPLFGYGTAKCPHNQVFARAALKGVVAALQQAKRRGRGVVAATRLAVEPNAWWGVAGGWEVEICWVYNERAPAWGGAPRRRSPARDRRGAAAPRRRALRPLPLLPDRGPEPRLPRPADRAAGQPARRPELLDGRRERRPAARGAAGRAGLSDRPQSMRTRSNSSQADMSDSTTSSPGASPSTTSIVFTDARPSRTRVRVASPPSPASRNTLTVLSSCPNTGRPT